MQASNATLRGLVSASPATAFITSISVPLPVESMLPAVMLSPVLAGLTNPIADGFAADSRAAVVPSVSSP